jgi:hypothetical protein
MIKNGLSNRHLEMGKIKIGGHGPERIKKGTKDEKYRLPVKYDHFVVTTTEKDKTDNFIKDAAIHKLIGEKPTELQIRLPFDDIDMNFHTSYAMYKGRKLKCKGDGVEATRFPDGKPPEKIECTHGDCEFIKSGHCKPSGILSCYIAKSHDIGGIYRLRTTSWNTVSGILAALKNFKENIPGGILQGLPFKLKMLKKNTAEHGNVTVVTIVGDGVAMAEMRQLGQEEQRQRLMLGVNPGDEEAAATLAGYTPEGNDDPGDIQDEFHPEISQDTEPAGTTADDAKKAMDDIEDATIVDEPEPEPENDSLL